MRRLYIFTIVFLLSFFAFAQHFSGTLIDIESKEVIPFATIQYSETNAAMSNEEGFFMFDIPDSTIAIDSISIVSLGYIKKQYSVTNHIPDTIFLSPKIFDIPPVVITNKNVSVDDIIDKVKDKLVINYRNNYSKNTIFIRERYTQKLKHVYINVKKSSIENINQTLFDTILRKIPKSFTSLAESYGVVLVKNQNKAKIDLQRAMTIQSKHQQASIKSINDDFFRTIKKNTKSNSYLIIKSGIIRLDKTESIDSILKSDKKRKIKDDEKSKMALQSYREQSLNRVLTDLFINEDASVDFLNNSGRYNFVKIGYVELGDDLAYVIEFSPKWSAKYKGKLYVNIDDYSIVKAEIQGANKIFDKHFNMLGISSNDLSYNSVVIFSKNKTGSYSLKYLKIETTQEAGIDRPIKIIEKNKFVKGRRKQNEVSFQMQFKIYTIEKKEFVFNQGEIIPQEEFSSYKPDIHYILERKSSYDVHFWDGLNILTPEKVIRDLKIE